MHFNRNINHHTFVRHSPHSLCDDRYNTIHVSIVCDDNDYDYDCGEECTIIISLIGFGISPASSDAILWVGRQDPSQQ